MPAKKKIAAPQYNPGDRIFAKVKGHPHWPARIEECNTQPHKVDRYPIFFYGTHEIYWLNARDIYPFERNKERLGAPKTLKGYNVGLWEIEHDPDVCFGAFEQQVQLKKEAVLLSTDQTAHNGADDSHTQMPEELADPSQEPSASEQEALEHVQLSMSESGSESDEVEVAPGVSSATRKLSEQEKRERQEEKRRVRRINYEKRKKTELSDLQLTLRLLRLDAALKESVTSSSCDVARALLVLDELRALPITADILTDNAYILKALNKLLKFSGDVKIKRKAEFVYSRWMHVYLQATQQNLDKSKKLQ